jgi:hypothetical protein
MIKIAHRGNVDGPGPLENSPGLIYHAIQKGFNVEVDIRLINSTWYLGHDFSQYPVGDIFVDNIKDVAWFHCKNINALNALDKNKHMFFWHQEDDFTLTSNGYIWTYPGKNVTEKSIIVDLNLDYKYNNVYGICTDYPSLVE